MDKKTLISTRVGSYVWYPILQLIDFIPKGSRKSEFIIHLKDSENTELRAMIKATKDMLTKLNSRLKENK